MEGEQVPYLANRLYYFQYVQVLLNIAWSVNWYWQVKGVVFSGHSLIIKMEEKGFYRWTKRETISKEP